MTLSDALRAALPAALVETLRIRSYTPGEPVSACPECGATLEACQRCRDSRRRVVERVSAQRIAGRAPHTRSA